MEDNVVGCSWLWPAARETGSSNATAASSVRVRVKLCEFTANSESLHAWRGGLPSTRLEERVVPKLRRRELNPGLPRDRRKY